MRKNKDSAIVDTFDRSVSNVTRCLVVAGHSIPVESFGRIQLWGDLMQIRRVDAEDAGRYICRAINQVGEQGAETHLSVTSKLNARIQPRVQVWLYFVVAERLSRVANPSVIVQLDGQRLNEIRRRV